MSNSKSLTLPTDFGKFGREIRKDCNEINILETDDVKQAKLEMWIARNVGETLMDKYPNREWGINVDIFNQMLIIRCSSVSSTKGYHISLMNKTMQDLKKRAVMAAGEILERHGVTRNRGFDSSILETLPRDVKDDVITPDGSADPDPINVKPRRD